MRYLVQHIGEIQNPVDWAYWALQALHPPPAGGSAGAGSRRYRYLWLDYPYPACRARPTRNHPEVKDAKTESSHRIVGLLSPALPCLQFPAPATEISFGEDKSLSRTQICRMCGRIQQDTGFSENTTPTPFRTVILTEMNDQAKDINLPRQRRGAPLGYGPELLCQRPRNFLASRCRCGQALLHMNWKRVGTAKTRYPLWNNG